MIRAAIFDLNGIFIQAPNLSDRLAHDYGVNNSDFLVKLLDIMHKIRQPGAGSAWDHWKVVLEELKLNFSEEGFWDYWFGAEKVSDRMVAFAKNLREKGIKVFVLSNNFKERSNYYDHYPWIHEAVDKVYFSWQTGLVKPDIRAWQNVLEENNLKAEECVYFDDQERNLEASEKAGIKAFKFKGEEDLEEKINALI